MLQLLTRPKLEPSGCRKACTRYASTTTSFALRTRTYRTLSTSKRSKRRSTQAQSYSRGWNTIAAQFSGVLRSPAKLARAKPRNKTKPNGKNSRKKRQERKKLLRASSKSRRQRRQMWSDNNLRSSARWRRKRKLRSWLPPAHLKSSNKTLQPHKISQYTQKGQLKSHTQNY